MNSKTIDKGNYKLHLYKTDKFKSVEIHVVLTSAAKTDNYLISALKELIYLTSSKYKTKRDRYIKEEDLYNESFYLGTSTTGRMNLFSISCSFINPKLVNDDYAEEAIKYPFDIFNNPLFDESRLDEIKDKLKYNYKKIIERPESYAYKGAVELYFDDPSDLIQYYVEDEIVDTITMKQIEDKYNELINNSNIDVFILGDYDDKWIDYIDNNLNLKSVNKEFELYINNPLTDNRKSKVETKKGINQAQIYNIYNLPILSIEDRINMFIFNHVLGVGFKSRLFSIVREKYHLCYTVYSGTNTYQCLMYIYTGVDDKNIDEAKKHINEIMNNMGDITQEEFDTAKTMLLRRFESIEDSLYGIYDRLCAEILLGRMPLDKEIELIKNASLENVIKMKDLIHLNTEYVLKGEE